MGVVKRQSIKQSIVTYTGIAIGAVNVLFIYPKFLSEEEWGILQYVLSIVATLIPFIMFGAASLVIRFFPNFKDEKRHHNGFLTFLLLLSFTGFGIFCLLAFLFRGTIEQQYAGKSGLYLQYLPYVLPIVLLTALAQLFTAYISNFQRIVVPQILVYLVPKITQPLLVIGYTLAILSFTHVFDGLLLSFVFIVLALVLYLRHLGQFSLSFNKAFFTKSLNKDLFTYASYGLLGTLSGSIINRIDIIMVGNMIDLPNVAAYGIAFFIAEVIDVPRKAIEKIVSPLIAKASVEGDRGYIKEMYVKTSLNQLIAGLFLLIGIWASIDNVFDLMPNGENFVKGKYVILILGLATIVDLATGINAHIIGYSRYFRFNFYLILIIAITNIFNNWLLIPMYLINGAAIATFLSKMLHNIIKTAYVWQKMRIHPFSLKTLYVVLIGVVCYAAAAAIPDTGLSLVDILLRSATISLLYGGAILYFRISPDVNDLMWNSWLKLRRVLGNK